MVDLTYCLEHLRVRKSEKTTEIFDPIRRRWVVLQPEEMVRQSAIYHLHHQYHIPFKHLQVEKSLNVHKLIRRYDLIVKDRNGKNLLLVECKSPREKLKQNTIDQVAYYNITIQAPLLWMTNGHDHLIYEIDHTLKSFKKIDTLPKLNMS